LHSDLFLVYRFTMPLKRNPPESMDLAGVEKLTSRICKQAVGKAVFQYLHLHGASAVQDIRLSIGCHRDKVNMVLKILKAEDMLSSRALTPDERVTERVNRKSLIWQLNKKAQVLVKHLCES